MRIRNLAPLAVLFVGLTALACADADTEVDDMEDVQEVTDEMGDDVEQAADEMEDSMEEIADDTTAADTTMSDDGAITEGDADTMEE